ncbi:pyridoxal kinase [Brucella anthropi]|uniref:pyridoxal kinase n=1 Tax=Brucella anthropi TaxID=529 RepID=A0A7V8B8T0_BRUAN|nr:MULTISPECIES: pyridoxal kinase [Brucella/Ochrobactrum group]MCR5939245.1 pyridoxal kinase [Ochrobactrum sp. XJ1]KAB2731766.1 pyridoxal kinase [Brucella anthropi]KAB2754925.1 pyridoxal kinase [Brucella anthropi]KAB2764555.1 pyridoxal kinase [Brucella anthropi]MBA8858361.1 pyridoxine kinase [Brucella anthropi]
MTAKSTGMTTSIISIQSQVVHGHVGNSAAVLPMQAHGLNVAAVPTTLLSNNPHFETMRGRVLESELVGDLLRGVEERGLIETSHYIVSGYLGSQANGNVVAAFVERARQINPDIKYICDPVMGDMNLGIFVADQVVECIVERLVPLADLLTPNQFELGLIAQTDVTSWAALETAAGRVQALHGAQLVVTSCELADTPEGLLENIVFDHETRTRLISPRLPIVPVGTGDLFTGLLTTKLTRGNTLIEAARSAAATVLEVLRRTMEAGERDMQLASVIDALIPSENAQE